MTSEPEQVVRPRRARRWWLGGPLLFLAAGGWLYFARPTVENPALPSRALAALEAKLAQPIELNVSAVPAATLLEELGQKYDVAITVEPNFEDSFPRASTASITHHVPRLSLGDAIRLVAWEKDRRSVVTVKDEGVHIAAREKADDTTHTRFFPLTALAARLEMREDRLRQAVLNAGPISQDPFGAQLPEERRPGGLMVVAKSDEIARMERLTAALDAVSRAPDYRPQWVNPVDAADEEIVRNRLAARLESTPELTGPHTLAEILEQMERQMGVPIALDGTAIEAVGASRDTIIESLETGIPWQDSLHLLLQPLVLGFTVKHGAVRVSLPEKAFVEPRLRLYPVGDLLAAAPGEKAESLELLVQSTVAAETWDPFVVGARREHIGNNLFISQSLKVHAQIEATLAQLRRVLAGGETTPLAIGASGEPSRGDHEILAALERPVWLEVKSMPLEDVVNTLRRQTGVRFVVDRKALEAANVELTSPVTLNLSGVPLRQGLRTLLAAFDLTYRVTNSVLTITTPEDLGALRVTQVYGLGHLVDPLQGLLLPGQTDREVSSLVDPSTWHLRGGESHSQRFGSALVVADTADKQRKLGELLAGLAASQNRPAEVDSFDVLRPSAAPLVAARTRLAERVNWKVNGTNLLSLAAEPLARSGLSLSRHCGDEFSRMRLYCHLQDVPLADALDLAFQDFEVDVGLEGNHAVLSLPNARHACIYSTLDFPAEKETLVDEASASFDALIALGIPPEGSESQARAPKGNTVRVRNGYLIAERPPAQQRIGDFFTNLRDAQARERAGELPAVYSAPDDELLARSVSLDIAPTSLDLFAEQLAEKLQVSVYCSYRLNSHLNLSCRVNDRPLVELLRKAVNRKAVSCNVRHGVIVFEPAERATLETRVYHVGSLANLEFPASDGSGNGLPNRLPDALRGATNFGEWIGSADAVLCGQLLAVRHTSLGHYEVRRFLEKLRAERQVAPAKK